ncbi:MAG: GrpB family protein [Acidimicrobiia bacterium]
MTGSGDLDDELDRVLIGGRERRTIRIERYSDGWPRRFERERKRIEDALGPVARRIEHIGSTAVPGLAAKPVIDIMVTVDDPDDEAAFVEPMEKAGYRLRVRERGHRMFRTPERDVHVHVWAADSDDERRHVLFRDWLRAHPADRLEYENAKLVLAGEWSDMNYYARAKGPVIDRILEHAQAAAAKPTHPRRGGRSVLSSHLKRKGEVI